MPDDDHSRFLFQVLWVRENARQRIAEHGDRLGKGYGVLPQIGSSFAWVPIGKPKTSRLLPEYARKFCNVYVEDLSASRAARRAGLTCDVIFSPGTPTAPRNCV